MTNSDVLKHIDKAIARLKKERRPLQEDASERSFAHRLAVHMERLFTGWDVDCEYDRHGMVVKTLYGIKGCDKQKKTDRILPDIVVHKRTNDSGIERNLLVIEIKKRSARDVCDEKKLVLLTKQSGNFRYQIGLYLNIVGMEFKKTWYRAGAEVHESELRLNKE